MIVPTPHLWIAGEVPDAELLTQNINDVVDFLMDPPFCKVHQTSSQTISHSTWTAINFQVVDKDNDGMADLGTYANRLTIQTPGWYEFEAGWALNSTNTSADYTGRRICAIGCQGYYQSRCDYRPMTVQAFPDMYKHHSYASFMNKGDIVALDVWQGSGVSRTTNVSSTAYHATLTAKWISN